MKIAPIRTNQRLANSLEKFSEQGGEKIAIKPVINLGISNASNFATPLSKEEQEKMENVTYKVNFKAKIQ